MFLLRLLSYLPFWILYRVSDFLFLVSYYVVRYRRKVVIENLRRSFPEKTESEIEVITKKFYKSLCDYGVETLKLLTISKEDLKVRMVYKNPEILQKHADSNQSVLLLASHQFNWEWLLAAGSFYLPMSIDFVYQEQNNKGFNQFSLACRTRFGAHAIQRRNVAREAIRRRNIVRSTAIVADQFPSAHYDKRFWTVFLNQETAFFQGISQLATLMQAPVYYTAIRKLKRGYYTIELIPLAMPPYEKESYEMVEAYVRETERLIRQHPSDWLWSHKRWKKTKDQMGD